MAEVLQIVCVVANQTPIGNSMNKDDSNPANGYGSYMLRPFRQLSGVSFQLARQKTQAGSLRHIRNKTVNYRTFLSGFYGAHPFHLRISVHQCNFGVSNKLTQRILYSFDDSQVLVYAVRHLSKSNRPPRRD